MLIPTIMVRRGRVELIDQRLLPDKYKIISVRGVRELCDAIKTLAIRGAPALGVAGAFGLLLAVEEQWSKGNFFFDMEEEQVEKFPGDVSLKAIREKLEKAGELLSSTRPTAVNLSWALARLRKVYSADYSSPKELLRTLYNEAMTVYREDIKMCQTIGSNGEKLLKDGDAILTHCNTGGLATSGYGTALGVVFSAVEGGKKISVFADETRPLLQGARLTAWECVNRGIPVTILTEGMAAYILSRRMVACIIVGADRIAANGDSANKIGTFNLAVLADKFGIPFYVAAPSSTIDLSIEEGSKIPIEERSPDEIKQFAGVRIAPEGACALNPAFDVTPGGFISAIITEKGIIRPPFNRGVLFG